jgi:hypothetical protein
MPNAELNLSCTTVPRYINPATPHNTGQKRGPVMRRRFQKGCFTIRDGRMFSSCYIDTPDGTKLVKKMVGRVAEMSERAARREHARIMEEVNRQRGSVARHSGARRLRMRLTSGDRQLHRTCPLRPYVNVKAICGSTSYRGSNGRLCTRSVFTKSSNSRPIFVEVSHTSR